MTETGHSYSVLLIDDDPYEIDFVQRALELSSSQPVTVIQESHLGPALDRLHNQSFDLILLDNRLSRTISAEIAVPAINALRVATPLAVLTADTSPDYLGCPNALAVDHIVDKLHLINFLRSRFSGRSSDPSQIKGTTCDNCEMQGRPACPRIRDLMTSAAPHPSRATRIA